MSKKDTVWAVYNRVTQFVESAGHASKEEAEAHIGYLLSKGAVHAELSSVEVPK